MIKKIETMVHDLPFLDILGVGIQALTEKNLYLKNFFFVSDISTINKKKNLSEFILPAPGGILPPSILRLCQNKNYKITHLIGF